MYNSHQQGMKVDELGKKLSLAIHCPIHFPAHEKNIFECKCGVTFPLFLVKQNNWEEVKKRHNQLRNTEAIL